MLEIHFYHAEVNISNQNLLLALLSPLKSVATVAASLFPSLHPTWHCNNATTTNGRLIVSIFSCCGHFALL